MLAKNLLILVVACFVASTQAAFLNNSLECHKKHLEELDEYLKQMELVHDSKRRFPETMPELREACEINRKVTNMMHDLAEKCMSGFTKNIMQVTIYSIRKSSKSLCRKKPTKEIKEFLDAGKCINAGREAFRHCIHETTANIMSVRRVESKKRIPLICCETVRAKQCLLDEARNIEQCTDRHLEILQSRYSHASSNSMNMACGEYNEDTDKCNHMLPPPDVDYNQTPKSFMMAAMELIDLFENDPDLQIPN